MHKNQQSFSGLNLRKSLLYGTMVLSLLALTANNVAAQTTAKTGTELASNPTPAATKAVSNVMAEAKSVILADIIMHFKDIESPILFSFINTKGGSKTFDKVEMKSIHKNAIDGREEEINYVLQYFTKDDTTGQTFWGFGDSRGGTFCLANEYANELVGAYKAKGLYCAVPKN
jgi:hypothetical protein